MEEVAFGRYQLLSVIGEGGMGKVFKAHDTEIGRDVAIKVLPAELGAEPEYRERFRREAQTAARLTEPHIVPIYDTGEIEGQLYLVMPVIAGIDVHSLLQRDGPMSPQRAVQVIAQLAAALDAAHQHGLVHRDIKPSNALLTGDDFVYLIDFGIAHGAATTRLTSTGMMVGTLAYMAPERFTTGTADARADVYSLACVLYECLTGAQPFPAVSVEQQIAGHLTLDPPQPSSVNPAVPAGFDEVIAVGMAKNPDQRYQSARELATAAHRALTEAPAHHLHPAPTPPADPTRPAPAPTLGDDQPTPAPAAARHEPANATPPPQQRQKSTNTRQMIQRDKLGSRTKIGQGGQGVVYRAPNVKTKFAASMVYKEYKTQARGGVDFTALAAMPALVEDSLSYAQAERLISIAAWPCALVEDGGTPTGFVMPVIPEEFVIQLRTVKGVSSTTAEFQHLLNHSSVLDARGIDIDDAQRFTLLREVASGLAFLHKHGVCVGDISPKNLLFSLTPHAAVYFIDCDAMRINGVSALHQVETPGWDTPAGEELATIYSDTYKLGLLALRLLAGDHDTTHPQHIPATTPGLLRQIITDTLTNARQQRPLPEAWTYVLGYAIEQAQHHNTLASSTAAPAPTAPTPPSIPTVRSRPTAHSAPPVHPSAPPIPTLHSRPTAHSAPPVHPSAPPIPTVHSKPPAGPSPPAPVSKTQMRWWYIPATATAVIAVVTGIYAIGYNLLHHHGPASLAPTAQSAPFATSALLEPLLLTPAEINTAMGITGLVVTGPKNPEGGFNDDSTVADKACIPLFAGADTSHGAYLSSGWTAMRTQELEEPGASPNTVDQTVVSFSSADKAADFFASSAQQWPGCSNRQYTATYPGQTTEWSVGPISNTNGTLGATNTQTTNTTWQCQRALTVANNVAIDIRACSFRPSSDIAANIAHQIAAKVPTK